MTSTSVKEGGAEYLVSNVIGRFGWVESFGVRSRGRSPERLDERDESIGRQRVVSTVRVRQCILSTQHVHDQEYLYVCLL